jgi:hypothetical protein
MSAALLMGVIVTATAEPPERLRNRGGLTGAVALGSTIMNRNRAIVIIANGRGQAGSIASGSSVGNGGFWITTNNPYIFAAGPTVAGVIGADTAAFIGGPFSQVEPGSPVFSELAQQGGVGILWDTADPDDAANFPSECTVDATRQELFPTLASFAGEPFPGFADQVVCLGVTDVLGPVCADCSNKRLGIEIVETWFSFSVPSVQDFIFVAFRIYNRSEFITAANAPVQQAGPYTIEDMSVSIAIDPDVGDSGDDQISFLPEVQTMIYWDSNFNESAFIGTPGVGGVTYLLTPTDPDTGEEVGLSQFSVFVRGTVRPDPNSPEEWYEVLTGDPAATLFETAPTDIRGQASSGLFDLPAGGVVEIYGAFFFAPAAGVPPDLLLAERPCNVTVLGQKCTDPALLIPDANQHPVLDNIKAVQPTAQAVFDAGFVVPTAPPKPNARLIPGDGEITIVWDGSPLDFVNPFAKVARDPFKRLGDGSPDPEAPGTGVILAATDVIFDATRDVGGTSGFVEAQVAGLTGEEVTNTAFNLDFLIQDFSGFRVYKTVTGSTDDAEVIASFDLADGFVDGAFCTQLEEVSAAGEFVKAVCTQIESFDLGSDGGLSFAFTDQGLINGIPVNYSVTSFSVNPGSSPVGDVSDDAFNTVVPAPAPLSLESGLAPLLPTSDQDPNSGTPRSNASSFVNATIGDAFLLRGEGVPLEGNSVDLPLDANLLLTGPVPGNRDFAVVAGVVNALAIPADFEARIVIDKATVGTEFFGIPYEDNVFGPGALGLTGFDQLPGIDARGRIVEFHVEDGNGNVLLTPAGEARAQVLTGFISFTGVSPFATGTLSILGPEDPELGVAFTVSWSSSVGNRSTSCARAGATGPPDGANCTLLDSGRSGLPASVNTVDFEVGAYGQYHYGDLEVVWSNQGGVLTLSSVTDVSNGTSVLFDSDWGSEGWGFAAETGLGPNEEADAAAIGGVPRTASGKVLYPDPLFTFVGGQNSSFGGAQQGAAHWTDLPFDPDIGTVLAPHSSTFSGPTQPGALQQTAALFTCPAGGSFGCATAVGLQGTRLWLVGTWLDLAFNSLPADGETWIVQLPNGVAGTPRPPVPGVAIAIPMSGGTNDPNAADLSQISVVPNPFIAANEIQRGTGLQQILFTNLPPQATIRIYTISGNLLRVIEHSDGSGTEPWDVRTRFDLLAASGNYYFHVTTRDGRTRIGRFAVIN